MLSSASEGTRQAFTLHRKANTIQKVVFIPSPSPVTTARAGLTIVRYHYEVVKKESLNSDARNCQPHVLTGQLSVCTRRYL